MKEFNPKVSIVIPVYNGSNYLSKAIDSALNQTCKNIEVIVVNDGSNDGGKTDEIARSYGDRIRYFYKDNGGVASALNLGILEMRGEYFSWLSHDDVYMPNKVEVQIDYLRSERRNSIILYSDYYWIDSESEILGTYKVPHVPPEYFLYALITSYSVNGCTTLVPKSCFTDVGLFNEKLKAVQDYEMWFRLGKKYNFIHISDILVKSRLHPEQGTRAMRNILTESNNLYMWCLDNYSIDTIFPSRRTSAAGCYIKLAVSFKVRNYEPALRYALKLALQSLDKAKSKTITHYYERFLILCFMKCPRIFMYTYWKFISRTLTVELKRKWSCLRLSKLKFI